MKHPLEFFPKNLRKPFFIVLLSLTVILWIISLLIDKHLWTGGWRTGIISFEVAGTPLAAREITNSWKQASMLLSSTGTPNPDIVNVAYAFAAFGLGFDYLFMVCYALTLAFGSLLVVQKHSGWIRSLAVLAAYGGFAAALFDAVENYALFQVMLGWYDSGFPALAATCAWIKFGLLLFGIVVCLLGAFSPKEPDEEMG